MTDVSNSDIQNQDNTLQSTFLVYGGVVVPNQFNPGLHKISVSSIDLNIAPCNEVSTAVTVVHVGQKHNRLVVSKGAKTAVFVGHVPLGNEVHTIIIDIDGMNIQSTDKYRTTSWLFGMLNAPTNVSVVSIDDNTQDVRADTSRAYIVIKGYREKHVAFLKDYQSREFAGGYCDFSDGDDVPE